MSYNFITKVEAPEVVLPNVPFSIRFRSWYLCIPFIRFNKIVIISNDDKILDRIEESIVPFWFWGYTNYITFDLIDKDMNYIIEVGYED